MTEYRARVWELRAGGVGTLATASGTWLPSRVAQHRVPARGPTKFKPGMRRRRRRERKRVAVQGQWKAKSKAPVLMG
jgi:hypothetical protein